MIRFLFRLFGLLIFAAAVIFAVMDGARSIAQSEIALTPFAESWATVSQTSLTGFEFLIQERLGMPDLWDSVFVPMLGLPTWGVLGAIGILFLLIGRRRKERRRLQRA